MNQGRAVFIPLARQFFPYAQNFRFIVRHSGINKAGPRYTQVKVMRSSGAGAPKNIARAAPPTHCNPPESMWVKHVPSGNRGERISHKTRRSHSRRRSHCAAVPAHGKNL